MNLTLRDHTTPARETKPPRGVPSPDFSGVSMQRAGRGPPSKRAAHDAVRGPGSRWRGDQQPENIVSIERQLSFRVKSLSTPWWPFTLMRTS